MITISQLLRGLNHRVKPLVKDVAYLAFIDLLVYLIDALVELVIAGCRVLTSVLSYDVDDDHTSQQLTLTHVPRYEL